MKLPVALLIGLLGSLTFARGATLLLNFTSAPGDFIGGGQTLSLRYDTDQGSQVSAQIRRTLSSGAPAELLFVINEAVAGPANSFGLVFFGTDGLGIPIQPGAYIGAQRADFASAGHPGMDISFQNRGCNIVSGSFNISEVTFNPAGTIIQTFAATFEQHCEGLPPALIGSVRYDLVPVPEPCSTILFVTPMAMLCSRRQRRRLKASP